MAGTVVSTTPRTTYGGRTLSSRERQLQARFRTSRLPAVTNYGSMSHLPSRVRSSQQKTASVLGRQGASMLAGIGVTAAANYLAPTLMANLGASAASMLGPALSSLMSTMAAAAPYIAVALIVASLIMGRKKGLKQWGEYPKFRCS